MNNVDRVWNKFFPLRLYFESNKLIIYTTCASWPNIDKVFDYFHNNKKTKQYLFITMDWGPTYRQNINYWKKYLKYEDMIIFLSNDINTHKNRQLAGLKSYLINHNCWINENIFTIKKYKKTYDAVITARAKKWKRIYLANKIKNLAMIINRWNIDGHRGENDNSYIKMDKKFINNRRLKQIELVNIYNISRVGLCLSNYEGASYTSSEYLLCGIPVVSTKPEISENGLGGREFWYDDYNSILCEPTESAIFDAVYNLINRNCDSNKIRMNHINKMIQQRELFLNNILIPIFTKYKIDKDPRIFFYNNIFDNVTNKCKLLPEGHMIQYSQLEHLIIE